MDDFLEKCFYTSGPSYADSKSFRTLSEQASSYAHPCNKLWYFAIPASAFGDAAAAIRSTTLERERGEEAGWTRIILEKPFGHDSESCQVLTDR